MLYSFLTLALVLSTVSAIPQINGGSGDTQTTVAVPDTTTGLGNIETATSAALSETSTSVSTSSSDMACNNSPALCDLAYNAVTYMGAHDSPFLRDDSTSDSTAGNQFFNATYALNAGLRLLQGQVHVEEDGLHLCHTSCSLLDAGRLDEWLAKIKTWMDENQNEVVTLILVNSDDAEPATFAADFESANLNQYAYTPSSTEATANWPSLRSMIESNTRLVSYIASITYDSTYPYLLPEFAYVFETEYEVLSLSGFNCSVDRPSNLVGGTGAEAIASNYLSLVNHFAYKNFVAGAIIPNVDDIETTNSADTNTTGALGTHAFQCQTEWGTKPTYVLVDFFNEGDVMAVADSLNGLSTTQGRSAVPESDDDTSGANGNSDVGTGIALVAFVAAAVSLF